MSKLSVIIPNYNHAKYIRNAINSVRQQSRKPNEILIIDDGSTDESMEIIQEIAKLDTTVRIIQHKSNKGVVYTIQEGLESSDSEYLFIFSADDFILPGLFEEEMNILERYPEAGLCCADHISMQMDTGDAFHFSKHWSVDACYFSPDELAEVIRGWCIPSYNSIIKRSALIEAGGFVQDLLWHCDWFAYLVTGFRNGICYIPKPFTVRRTHPDSYSAKNRRDWAKQSSLLKTILMYIKSEEYRDVLPYFVRGSVMFFFYQEIDKLVMMNPDLWDNETLMLVQKPLWDRLSICREYIDSLWRNQKPYQNSGSIRKVLGIKS